MSDVQPPVLGFLPVHSTPGYRLWGLFSKRYSLRSIEARLGGGERRMGVVLRVTTGPHQGQEYSIGQTGTFVVGRSTRASFPMTQDLALSREHFQIENFPPVCHLVDLGSTNGTKVNGMRVERVLLREGDVISAGDSSFTLFCQGPENESDLAGTCAGCGARLDRGSLFGRQGIKNKEDGGVTTASALSIVRLCEACDARRR